MSEPALLGPNAVRRFSGPAAPTPVSCLLSPAFRLLPSVSCALVCYAVFLAAVMPPTIALPRICIAMGFPEAQRLLENARRETNAGESFFEFRLDYLPAPEQGIPIIRKFLVRSSGLLHSGNLPPSSKPWQIQRQRGRPDPDSQRGPGRRGARHRHRNRKR